MCFYNVASDVTTEKREGEQCLEQGLETGGMGRNSWVRVVTCERNQENIDLRDGQERGEEWVK